MINSIFQEKHCWHSPNKHWVRNWSRGSPGVAASPHTGILPRLAPQNTPGNMDVKLTLQNSISVPSAICTTALWRRGPFLLWDMGRNRKANQKRESAWWRHAGVSYPQPGDKQPTSTDRWGWKAVAPRLTQRGKQNQQAVLNRRGEWVPQLPRIHCSVAWKTRAPTLRILERIRRPVCARN